MDLVSIDISIRKSLLIFFLTMFYLNHINRNIFKGKKEGFALLFVINNVQCRWISEIKKKLQLSEYVIFIYVSLFLFCLIPLFKMITILIIWAIFNLFMSLKILIWYFKYVLSKS